MWACVVRDEEEEEEDEDDEDDDDEDDDDDDEDDEPCNEEEEDDDEASDENEIFVEKKTDVCKKGNGFEKQKCKKEQQTMSWQMYPMASREDSFIISELST